MHVLPHARGEGTAADAARRAMEHRTVRRVAAGIVPALHAAREALALADARDIHKFASLEIFHQHAVSDFRFVLRFRDAYFPHDLQRSHVGFLEVAGHRFVDALRLDEFDEAKLRGDAEVAIWGTGTPRREFLHAHDLADGLRFLLENYDSPEIINVGYGEDVTIYELAQIIAQVVGIEIDIVFDASKPDGTPRKLMDSTRLRNLGWKPRISLKEGIRHTYHWLLQNNAELKGWSN